jgi:hypothetical protein
MYSLSEIILPVSSVVKWYESVHQTYPFDSASVGRVGNRLIFAVAWNCDLNLLRDSDRIAASLIVYVD